MNARDKKEMTSAGTPTLPRGLTWCHHLRSAIDDPTFDRNLQDMNDHLHLLLYQGFTPLSTSPDRRWPPCRTSPLVGLNFDKTSPCS